MQTVNNVCSFTRTCGSSAAHARGCAHGHVGEPPAPAPSSRAQQTGRVAAVVTGRGAELVEHEPALLLARPTIPSGYLRGDRSSLRHAQGHPRPPPARRPYGGQARQPSSTFPAYATNRFRVFVASLTVYNRFYKVQLKPSLVHRRNWGSSSADAVMSAGRFVEGRPSSGGMPEPGGSDGGREPRLPAIEVDDQTAQVLVGRAP
jgi:hypothetical protein